MKTYVALLNWTQKGIQEFRDSPSRVDKAREAIAAAGGEMKSFYLTLCPFMKAGRSFFIALGNVAGELIHHRKKTAMVAANRTR